MAQKWTGWSHRAWSCNVDVGTIDYSYEHHSSEWQKLFKITGKVKQIKTLYCKRANGQKANDRKITSYKTYMVEKADVWDENIGEYKFSGYIVVLEDVSIASAKESEVTFE